MRPTSSLRRAARQRLASSLVLLVLAGAGALAAAELRAPALEAYSAHADEARERFLAYVPAGGEWPADRWQRDEALAAGEVAVGPGAGDGILGVPDGLIHHWVGAAFIFDATLDDVLAVAHDYARYPDLYESVIEAETLARHDGRFEIRLRIREGAGPVTGVLDVWSDVRYVRDSATQAYGISRATEIRQVESAGEPGERLLPAGNDSGYLWRAQTLTKYVARDGGVYVELETLGLSRGYPPMLGWLIEPIARRLGRKSVEGSLIELRDAVAPAPSSS